MFGRSILLVTTALVLAVCCDNRPSATRSKALPPSPFPSELAKFQALSSEFLPQEIADALGPADSVYSKDGEWGGTYNLADGSIVTVTLSDTEGKKIRMVMYLRRKGEKFDAQIVSMAIQGR